MKQTRTLLILTVLLVSSFIIPLAAAQKRMMKNRTTAPQKSGPKIEPSRLTPKFYKNAACTTISSAYGSTTRHDGSRRPVFRYNGRHGGIDLSLEPGTPLLAIASGTLVHKGSGKQMEVIYLWLLHTPEDTGFDKYVLTKYQHLARVPEIDVGQKVTTGQVIGYSGATGTHGGHYGSKGYPHLHLSTKESMSGKFLIKNNTLVTKAVLFDPLILYLHAAGTGKSSGKGNVIVPYVDAKGTIHPETARMVWPVACR